MLNLVVLLMVQGTGTIAAGDSLPWTNKDCAGYRLYYTKTDSSFAPTLENWIGDARTAVFQFFHRPFKNEFNVYVFPDRKSLDHEWAQDWKIDGFKSECWMVASGVARRFDLLSPLAWDREACDHRSNDSTAIRQIILHELVHVFHGQQNPRPGFDDMEAMAWLVEGLATWASGQLTEGKLKQVRESLAAGNIPASTGELWKGSLRYQQAGSLIRYIDRRYGREKLFSLLKATNTQEALQELNITESALMEAWQKNLAEGK